MTHGPWPASVRLFIETDPFRTRFTVRATTCPATRSHLFPCRHDPGGRGGAPSGAPGPRVGAHRASAKLTDSRLSPRTRAIIHLVQNVHQPMHVADRNDRGGNAVQLRFGRYDNANLHQVWDSGLLRRTFRNEDDLMRHLEALTTRPDAKDWLKGGPEDWANESLMVGRHAYEIPGAATTLRSGDSIGRAYEQEERPQGRRSARALRRPSGRNARRGLQRR
jgi:S1/P1 Nuclease